MVGHRLAARTRRRVGVIGIVVLTSAAALAACIPQSGAPELEAGAGPAPLPDGEDRSWPMHLIDGRWRGANALSMADANGDGHQDLLSMYEFDQRYEIALHPGDSGGVEAPWPTVNVWAPPAPVVEEGVNPESAALGDLDGDGNLDVVGAQGESVIVFWEGNAPGIRVFWGPPASEVGTTAFVDAGRIPGTTEVGHYHWVSTRDLSGDGLVDIVAGGREDDDGVTGGIVWFEAPADPAARRDLTQWQAHPLDPLTPSGHGFTFVDIDGDGDVDLADANADFDTAEDEERLAWYENPGNGTAAQEQPWPVHELLRAPVFHTKPQVAAGDLDADGDADLVTQTEHAVEVFLNDGAPDPGFERVSVPKDPRADFLSRTIRMGDVDGDGRMDLVGFLTHREASLPASKAAVYWAEYEGASVGTDWSWHTIRAGSGRTALITEFGEKWDQAFLHDVDDDGDLDVVANCEEWWMEDNGEFWPWFDPAADPQTQAVVWFENTMDEPAAVVAEHDGVAVVEAERPTHVGDGAWAQRGTYPGWSAEGYLQSFNAVPPWLDGDLPELDRSSGTVGPTSTAGARLDLELSGGTYSVWIRSYAPVAWSYAQGGPASDSSWLSIDGGASVVAGDLDAYAGEWRWVRVAESVALDAGTHEVTLRQRERGHAVDQVVLAPPGWTPPAGPA